MSDRQGMNVTLGMAELEHLVSTTFYKVDVYDSSRYPGLLETLIHACERLDQAGSELTIGTYPRRSLKMQVAWMKEHL